MTQARRRLVIVWVHMHPQQNAPPFDRYELCSFTFAPLEHMRIVLLKFLVGTVRSFSFT